MSSSLIFKIIKECKGQKFENHPFTDCISNESSSSRIGKRQDWYNIYNLTAWREPLLTFGTFYFRLSIYFSFVCIFNQVEICLQFCFLFFLSFSFFGHSPCSLRVLVPKPDIEPCPCSGSLDSWSLGHQGIPLVLKFLSRFLIITISHL